MVTPTVSSAALLHNGWAKYFFQTLMTKSPRGPQTPPSTPPLHLDKTCFWDIGAKIQNIGPKFKFLAPNGQDMALNSNIMHKIQNTLNIVPLKTSRSVEKNSQPRDFTPPLIGVVRNTHLVHFLFVWLFRVFVIIKPENPCFAPSALGSKKIPWEHIHSGSSGIRRYTRIQVSSGIRRYSSGIRRYTRIHRQTQSSRARTNGKVGSRCLAGEKWKTRRF